MKLSSLENDDQENNTLLGGSSNSTGLEYGIRRHGNVQSHDSDDDMLL